jgi:hypothetical protein
LIGAHSKRPPDLNGPDAVWHQRVATILNETIHGHDTAPTFFWGKLACQGCVQNSARGLILMGDWRDSGFTRVGSQCIEETDVMKKLGTGAVLRLT